MKILSFGEVLWDVYPNEKFLGGAPLNFAAHSARLGADVYMLSALGQDDLAAAALDRMKKWRVNTEYVARIEGRPTGQCLVTLGENAVPQYNLLQNVAYDFIPCDGVSEDFDVLYFGTLALRSESNYRSLSALMCSKRFGEIFVDINIRSPYYSADTVQLALKNATILKVSDEEMPTIADLLGMEKSDDYSAFAARLAAVYDNLRVVVITRGADGAYALDCRKNQGYSCHAVKAQVVSTVGAGDSFSAAFLYHYMQGMDIPACLCKASELAAYVVSKYDAVPD